MKSIVILRAGDGAAPLIEARGHYPGWIEWTVGAAWPGHWVVHDVRTDAPLPPLGAGAEAAAFIITGSSHSVTERTPWILRAEAYARDVIDRHVWLFGIGFGHQLVAQALGGHVARNARGPEIGTVRAERTGDDRILETVPHVFDVNACHVDTVSRLPSGARVLAQSALDPVQAYAVGETTWCVQFHPELDGDGIGRYLLARAAVIEAEGGDVPAIEARSRDTPHAAAILRNFARLVAANR